MMACSKATRSAAYFRDRSRAADCRSAAAAANSSRFLTYSSVVALVTSSRRRRAPGRGVAILRERPTKTAQAAADRGCGASESHLTVFASVKFILYLFMSPKVHLLLINAGDLSYQKIFVHCLLSSVHLFSGCIQNFQRYPTHFRR
jgi:hypothetical protein